MDLKEKSQALVEMMKRLKEERAQKATKKARKAAEAEHAAMTAGLPSTATAPTVAPLAMEEPSTKKQKTCFNGFAAPKLPTEQKIKMKVTSEKEKMADEAGRTPVVMKVKEGKNFRFSILRSTGHGMDGSPLLVVICGETRGQRRVAKKITSKTDLEERRVRPEIFVKDLVESLKSKGAKMQIEVQLGTDVPTWGTVKTNIIKRMYESQPQVTIVVAGEPKKEAGTSSIIFL